MLRLRLLLSCLIVWAAPLHAQSEGDLVAARAEALAARMPATHPRLLLLPQDLPALRRFVADAPGGSEVASLLGKLVQPVPAMIAEPQPVPTGGKKDARATEIWRTGYTQANLAGFTAWRQAFLFLAQDDAAAGREAARWLLQIASWDVNGGINIRSNDEAFIQSLRPMIFAYDWAYEALTPQERETVRSAIRLRLDILWRDISRKFSLVERTPPDNSLSHPMRFISTLGQGAQALWGESPGVEKYLAWAYEYYLRQFPVWGGDDGGWAEGLDYWGTGLTQHLRFLEGMKLLGFDEPLARPFFRHNGYFALYNLQPYDTSSFGDLTNITRPTPNRALLVAKYAQLNRDGYLMRYARGLSDRLPDGNSYYEFNALDSLLHLFRAAQDKVAERDLAELPGARVFRDIGWVAMHGALGDKERDVMLAFKSSPFGSASHSHSDQNAFVLMAYGQPLAISSGYRDWYGSAHHDGWSRSTQAKNAILIGEQGQPLKDASATGKIARFFSGPRYDFTTGDATAAYRRQAERVLRHILFVDRRYFVMLDELDAHEFRTYQWLLHARERMALDDRTASLTSSKGGAQLRVQFLVPEAGALRLSQTDQFAVPPDAAFVKRMPNEWHARAETITSSRTQDFVSVLMPARLGESSSQATRLPASRGYALRVEQGALRDLVLLGGERAGGVVAGDTQLSGLAAVVTQRADGGAWQRFVLIDGKQLRADELEVEASTAVSLEGAQEAMGIVLQIEAPSAARLSLRLPAAPRAVQGLAEGTWGFDAQQGMLQLQVAAGQTRVRVLR